MKKLLISGLFIVLITLCVVPFTTQAFTLLPCDGGAGDECQLEDLVKLIENIINAIIILSIPFMTVALTYVGFLILTAQGNVNKLDQAKRIAKMTIIGFVFILTAWLIVNTINSYFFKDGFNLFMQSNKK